MQTISWSIINYTILNIIKEGFHCQHCLVQRFIGDNNNFYIAIFGAQEHSKQKELEASTWVDWGLFSHLSGFTCTDLFIITLV